MDEIHVLKKEKRQFETALLKMKMNVQLVLTIQKTLLGLPNQTVCEDLPRKKGRP